MLGSNIGSEDIICCHLHLSLRWTEISFSAQNSCSVCSGLLKESVAHVFWMSWRFLSFDSEANYQRDRTESFQVKPKLFSPSWFCLSSCVSVLYLSQHTCLLEIMASRTHQKLIKQPDADFGKHLATSHYTTIKKIFFYIPHADYIT